MKNENYSDAQEELESNELFQSCLALHKHITLNDLKKLGCSYKPLNKITGNKSYGILSFDCKEIKVTCKHIGIWDKKVIAFQNNEERFTFQKYLFDNYSSIFPRKILRRFCNLLILCIIGGLGYFIFQNLNFDLIRKYFEVFAFVPCCLMVYCILNSIVNYLSNK